VHRPTSADDRQHPRGPQTAADRMAPRLDGVHVLAVDDEPDALGLVRVALEEAGARVTTVTSGSAALDALTEAAPDVLIADIGMPGMDGLSLIRAIRQTLEDPGRSIPAAALTAYARSQDRTAALASGFQAHIPKPVDPDELVAAVAALAARRSVT
jgi:CheY-like chemotaxis protein